jgi:hypothetical protein
MGPSRLKPTLWCNRRDVIHFATLQVGCPVKVYLPELGKRQQLDAFVSESETIGMASAEYGRPLPDLGSGL